MKPFFIWKNEYSTDKKIIVKKLPDIEKADKDVEKIVVPGRSGFLVLDSETYQGTVKPVECILDASNESIEELCNWMNGSGDLIFSNEPDRVYKATIISKVPFSKIATILYEFTIAFDCQPFKYNQHCEKLTITKASNIYNPGTVCTEPILKIYGTGDVSIDLNGDTFTINNLLDYITVDSTLQDAYKDMVSMNNNMKGEFPVLQPGTNAIAWTGNITKIEITPNFRYL